MRVFIERSLKAFKELNGRPIRIGIVNRGGTITAIANPKGKLEPLEDQKKLERILEISELGDYKEENLLDYTIILHDPFDSSQMLDAHHMPTLQPIQVNYTNFDAFAIFNGTDTAERISRYLHFAFPYYTYSGTFERSFNADKPIVIVSSQESMVVKKGRRIMTQKGNDGDANLATFIALIAQNKAGEAGLLTNQNQVINCSTVKKITPYGIPQFMRDPGVSLVAERTNSDITFYDSAYLPRVNYRAQKVPKIIAGIDDFEADVLSISDHAHFNSIKSYLESRDSELSDIQRFLRARLPKVILYVSKGAGHIQGPEEIGLLREMIQEGIYVMRVPFAFGRILGETKYHVPGEEVMAVNIEAVTAKYKAQAVLSLLRNSNELSRSELFYNLMSKPFGNEFLPNS